eukprot:6179138-Pleurochrysis_carterae.AAC.1
MHDKNFRTAEKSAKQPFGLANICSQQLSAHTTHHSNHNAKNQKLEFHALLSERAQVPAKMLARSDFTSQAFTVGISSQVAADAATLVAGSRL